MSVMFEDGCQAGSSFSGFSLSLAVPPEAEADANRAFTDRFGIGWMVTVAAQP